MGLGVDCETPDTKALVRFFTAWRGGGRELIGASKTKPWASINPNLRSAFAWLIAWYLAMSLSKGNIVPKVEGIIDRASDYLSGHSLVLPHSGHRAGLIEEAFRKGRARAREWLDHVGPSERYWLGEKLSIPRHFLRASGGTAAAFLAAVVTVAFRRLAWSWPCGAEIMAVSMVIIVLVQGVRVRARFASQPPPSLLLRGGWEAKRFSVVVRGCLPC